MNAVIFDFGNVVIDWKPYLALDHLFASEAAMEETFAQIGFYAWNLEQDRGRSWADGLAAAERDAPEHAHIFRAYVERLADAHSVLIPGTADIIEELRAAGVRLFGLTNAARDSFEAVKRTAPVIAAMEDVVVSADVKLIKPDPAIYHTLLERNGLEPGDCFFVDDRPENCAAAEAVGIAAHVFTAAPALRMALADQGILEA